MSDEPNSAELRKLELQLFREIDSKLTDVRDRVIRIEAQDHINKINDLEKTVHEQAKEIVRIKTQIAPIMAFSSAAMATIASWVVMLLRNG